mgnify:CR=1 FL=1
MPLFCCFLPLFATFPHFSPLFRTHPLPPGSVLDSAGTCKQCGDGTFSNKATNKCDACTPGTFASKGLSYTRWSSLPSSFETSCDGSCESSGWLARGKYMKSPYSAGGYMDARVSFNVNVVTASVVDFVYQLNCAYVN